MPIEKILVQINPEIPKEAQYSYSGRETLLDLRPGALAFVEKDAAASLGQHTVVHGDTLYPVFMQVLGQEEFIAEYSKPQYGKPERQVKWGQLAEVIGADAAMNLDRVPLRETPVYDEAFAAEQAEKTEDMLYPPDVPSSASEPETDDTLPPESLPPSATKDEDEKSENEDEKSENEDEKSKNEDEKSETEDEAPAPAPVAKPKVQPKPKLGHQK